MDGDVDLFIFNDRGLPSPESLNRGYVHLWENDGTGHFKFIPPTETGLDSSQNMGHTIGDYNCDGDLDFFVTRMGPFLVSYIMQAQDIPFEIIAQSAKEATSAWIFGSNNGTFLPGNASHGVNGQRPHLPFGWGAATLDMEADGDQDVVFVGGLIEVDYNAGSPGAVLENLGCSGAFVRSDAMPPGHYNKFSMSGLSTGDLNNDGFPDLVSVAGIGSCASLPARNLNNNTLTTTIWSF